MLRSPQVYGILAIVAGLCTGPPLSVIADQPINLEQIQATAAKWRASFVNIRLVYERRSLPALDEPLLNVTPLETNSAPLFGQDEWIWADHGVDLLDSRAFYWSPGKVGYRNVDVFNGPKGIAFRANYQNSIEQVEELKAIQIQGIGLGKPISSIDRTAMRGLYWADAVEWLPEKLIKWECTVEGIEPVLGASCAKISSRYSARGKDTHIDILWLDLEHDCLPRRYQELPNSIRKIGADFVVDEVQQLESGLWFPKRARLQLQTKPPQNQMIVVTEAEVNLSLDATRFDSPAPITGTVVTDGRTGKVYTHGQQSPQQNLIAKSNPSPNSSSPSAVPQAASGKGWLIALICMSITMLVVGLWFRKKDMRG